MDNYYSVSHFKKILFLISTFSGFLFTHKSYCQNETFTKRVVNPGYQLNSAWELIYGPDDSLWVTENKAYTISRINPGNGGRQMLIDLSTMRNFITNGGTWPQGGLMGMALHPQLFSGKPYVYIAYVYAYIHCTPGAGKPAGDTSGPCFFKTRIARYSYNRATHTLNSPVTIIESLNGSNDHNSGRLTIGNISGSPYLFYTIGDMGAGQFNNVTRNNYAQTRDSLEGKVLRLNLEADGDAGTDGWIPNDNPFSDINSTKTAVWSWGHRNAQGIVFGNNGTLYSSEQQDKSDDEINIIESSSNYGWPKVSGYCDGNYNGQSLANQSIISEQTNCIALNAKEPIYTMFTAANPALLGTNNLTWPTVAPSSLDIYEYNVIPNWNSSLLVSCLKAGRIYRLKLNAAGTSVTDTSSIPASRGEGRFRDICLSPEGLRIYVACDISGQTSGPTGSFNGGGSPPPNAGRILEFTYTGTVLAIANDPQNPVNRESKLRVFPNPVNKKLFVEIRRNISKPIRYQLFDATGKMLLNGINKNDNFSINIEKLYAGIYIFKLFNGHDISIMTKKIVIR